MTRHDVLIEYFKEHGHIRVPNKNTKGWMSFRYPDGNKTFTYHVSLNGHIRKGQSIGMSTPDTDIWKKACHWWVGNQPSTAPIPYAWQLIFDGVNKRIKELEAWRKKTEIEVKKTGCGK